MKRTLGWLMWRRFNTGIVVATSSPRPLRQCDEFSSKMPVENGVSSMAER